MMMLGMTGLYDMSLVKSLYPCEF